MTTRAGSTMLFGPLTIEFDDRVLRPRPWTFAQVGWARQAALEADEGRILELCAGVGHIGLATAVLSHRQVLQIDRCSVACELARLNALRAGRHHQVEIRCAALDEVDLRGERFPVVIADPPYVPTTRIGEYPADPVGAIDGGADGLRGIRCSLDLAASQVTDGGTVILQVAGGDQIEAAVRIGRGVGLTATSSRMIGHHGGLVEFVRSPAHHGSGIGASAASTDRCLRTGVRSPVFPDRGLAAGPTR